MWVVMSSKRGKQSRKRGERKVRSVQEADSVEAEGHVEREGGEGQNRGRPVLAGTPRAGVLSCSPPISSRAHPSHVQATGLCTSRRRGDHREFDARRQDQAAGRQGEPFKQTGALSRTDSRLSRTSSRSRTFWKLAFCPSAAQAVRTV